MTIILPIATPIIFEAIRRLGARRMNAPSLSVECFPVGDEFGHRKWNIRVHSQELPRWARWLLDAQSRLIMDATLRIKLYNKISVNNWEETFPLRIFEIVWSDNIPAAPIDIEHLLNDGSLLSRAKRIHISRQDERVAALVMKSLGNLPFVLDPEAYKAGLPGQGRIDTQLNLEEYILVVNVRHAFDPKGKFFCFRLTNVGERLEQFNMKLLPEREASDCLKLIKPNFS